MREWEFSIIDIFGWTLPEINETDIEDLIPLVFEYPHWKEKGKRTRARRMFADQLEL